jgi:hypothetical protein
MTVSAESQKTIDAYLAALRRHLRELMEADANDIVEEIRAHILDKTAAKAPGETAAAAPETPASVSATLAALGTPEELASRYRTEELLKRAQLAASPGLILLRWTALGLATLLVCLVSAVGYCLGGALVMFALFKLLWPRGTGLWAERTADRWNASMFFGNQPRPGHELLGWWLIPIGLILGAGLLYLTFRFCTWSLSKFLRPRAWRQA